MIDTHSRFRRNGDADRGWSGHEYQRSLFERAPDIARKCKFIGMHGSVDIGYGGSAEPSDEYNVRADVPAFRAVLNADWHAIEITPLDSCGDIVLGGDLYQQLFRSDDPALVALV